VETIFVLLPLALLIAAIAVGFFIWAARTGQFDDLDTPAVRMLFDDEPGFRNQDSGIRSRESGSGNQESGARLGAGETGPNFEPRIP
jgi:cbb3-type cytochrome oxidase maturation protein